MTTRETKALHGVKVAIKDAGKGLIEAVFATLNVIDSDGDVTLPGAFTEGAPVTISAYGHASWGGALPVGKGTIRTSGDDAILSGRFFMDTVAGKDTFTVVKALAEGGDSGEGAPGQQWSYGYDVTSCEYGMQEDQDVRFLKGLTVFEVSPCLLGSGVNTRVLSAKSAPMTFVNEATAVLAALKALIDRAADVMAKRSDKGKKIGSESAAVLDQIETELKRLTDLRSAPTGEDLAELFQHEVLRSLRRKAGVAHVPGIERSAG